MAEKKVVKNSDGKKTISFREDSKYDEALTVMLENSPSYLPISNKSNLVSYILKGVMHQILNDKKTFLNNGKEVKRALYQIGFKEDTFLGMGESEIIQFAEDMETVKELEETLKLLKEEVNNEKAELDKYIAAKSKLEGEIESLEQQVGNQKEESEYQDQQYGKVIEEEVDLESLERIGFLDMNSEYQNEDVFFSITPEMLEEFAQVNDYEYESNGFFKLDDEEIRLINLLARSEDVKLYSRLPALKNEIESNGFVFVEENGYKAMYSKVYGTASRMNEIYSDEEEYNEEEYNEEYNEEEYNEEYNEEEYNEEEYNEEYEEEYNEEYEEEYNEELNFVYKTKDKYGKTKQTEGTINTVNKSASQVLDETITEIMIKRGMQNRTALKKLLLTKEVENEIETKMNEDGKIVIEMTQTPNGGNEVRCY